MRRWIRWSGYSRDMEGEGLAIPQFGARSAGWDCLQKKTLHATERDRPDVQEARIRFRKSQKTWESARLIFVDESGVNLPMTRSVAWAPVGKRAVDDVPGNRWSNYSVITGLRATGIVAPTVVPGAIDGQAMLQWVTVVSFPSSNRATS